MKSLAAFFLIIAITFGLLFLNGCKMEDLDDVSLLSGTPDSSFGDDGIVTTTLGAIGGDSANSVVIDGQGRIVVAGSARVGANQDIVVVRYIADGTLDASFGGDGVVTTSIGSVDDFGHSVALDSQGRIVVAGFYYVGTVPDIAVVRYTANGTLDTSFGGGDGIVTTSIAIGNDLGYSVALDSQGRIVVAGSSNNGLNQDIAVVRYTANGTLDTSFGSGDGIVTTPIGTGDDYGQSVLLDSQGRIVVAGYFYNGSNLNDIAVVRYNADGTLDASFGGDGIVTIGQTSAENAYSAVLDSNGKITVVGSSDGDIFVVRLNPNGTTDTSFGEGNGTVTTSIWQKLDVGFSVGIDSRSRIVVAGYSDNSVGVMNMDFAVVRYNPDGSLDTSFCDGAGRLATPIGTSNDFGRSVAFDSQGRIVVAGTSDSITTSDIAVVRYWP